MNSKALSPFTSDALLALLLGCFTATGQAADVKKDEAVDKAAGILNRPWEFGAAGKPAPTGPYVPPELRPGLPPFEQQVERASQVPAPLVPLSGTLPKSPLTTPTTVLPVTTNPRGPAPPPPVIIINPRG